MRWSLICAALWLRLTRAILAKQFSPRPETSQNRFNRPATTRWIPKGVRVRVGAAYTHAQMLLLLACFALGAGEWQPLYTALGGRWRVLGDNDVVRRHFLLLTFCHALGSSYFVLCTKSSGCFFPLTYTHSTSRHHDLLEQRYFQL
jgi:hypothetical protein